MCTQENPESQTKETKEKDVNWKRKKITYPTQESEKKNKQNITKESGRN